jgi:hypothetical protein
LKGERPAQEDSMKKILVVLLALAMVSCIRQTINTESRFLDSYAFDDVWQASIRAVNDIGFTIDSLDIKAGFIGAESGTHIGQEVPPRLSIFISEVRGRVYVDCKVLQKEQFIDIFGHGERTVRRFMAALNMNL